MYILSPKLFHSLLSSTLETTQASLCFKMQLCRALCLSAIADADEIDGVKPHGKIVNSEMRPKTPTFSGMESRPKTPLQNRPKTPTSQGYGMNSDARGKPSYGNRSAYDIYESRSPEENHVTKFSEGVSNERGHQENEYENSHVGTSNNIESLYERARPPTGPRMDPFRQNDIRLESRNRPEYRDGHGYGRQNEGDGYGYGYARDVKPGQFRSRTPGPEIMARGGPGPDYRTEAHRPKTPTAQDMRSKTPMPTSHTYGANDLRASGRYTPNPNMEYGRYGRPDYNRGWPDFSSPPVGRRYDSFENPSLNRSYGGELARTMGVTPAPAFGQNSPRGAGHPVRQSTSFETQDPTPSNLTRMPRRPALGMTGASYPLPPAGSAGQSPRSQSRGPIDQEAGGGTLEFTVQLHRQESGYGFRIIGGTEEGSQVCLNQSDDVILMIMLCSNECMHTHI